MDDKESLLRQLKVPLVHVLAERQLIATRFVEG